MKLFFNPKSKECFYVGVPTCSKCGVEIFDFLFIQENYSRKKSQVWKLCKKCLGKIPKTEVACVRMASIINDQHLPKDCVPLIIRPPSMVYGRMNTFDAARPENIAFETKVNDFTRVSGRPNYTFDDSKMDSKKQIYRADEIHDEKAIKECQKKCLKLGSAVNPEAFLEVIKNSEPLIEKKEKKKLEGF